MYNAIEIQRLGFGCGSLMAAHVTRKGITGSKYISTFEFANDKMMKDAVVAIAKNVGKSPSVFLKLMSLTAIPTITNDNGNRVGNICIR